MSLEVTKMVLNEYYWFRDFPFLHYDVKAQWRSLSASTAAPCSVSCLRMLTAMLSCEMVAVPSLDTSIIEVGCEEHPGRKAKINMNGKK